MTYWVIKWNPNKYDVDCGIRKVQDGTEWGVSKNTEPRDRIFIAKSGSSACVLVEVEATTKPVPGDSSGDPNWIDKAAAKKPGWFSKIRLIKSSLPGGVTETALRSAGLTKLTGRYGFLHRQGKAIRLSDSEATTLDSLFAICPVCGHNPCKNTFFLNKTMDLYRGCKDGVVICPQCGSEGYTKKTAPCPECLKAGYRPPGAVCPLCRNKGYISLGMEICPFCERKGEVTPAVAATFRSKSSS